MAAEETVTFVFIAFFFLIFLRLRSFFQFETDWSEREPSLNNKNVNVASLEGLAATEKSQLMVMLNHLAACIARYDCRLQLILTDHPI